MRLIINDILTDADKDAIAKGSGSSMIQDIFDLTDIESLRNTLSERDRHFFECLSWLIRNNKIDIKIIAPLSGEGTIWDSGGFLRPAAGSAGWDRRADDDAVCVFAGCGYYLSGLFG